jgi:FtsZ-binding cell division protein ZapB
MLTKDDAGFYSLRYQDLFAPIIRAIQELSEIADKRNNTITDEMSEIQSENKSLRDENASIRRRLDVLEGQLQKK